MSCVLGNPLLQESRPMNTLKASIISPFPLSRDSAARSVLAHTQFAFAWCVLL